LGGSDRISTPEKGRNPPPVSQEDDAGGLLLAVEGRAVGAAPKWGQGDHSGLNVSASPVVPMLSGPMSQR
jgi:hypothetical protein